MATDISEASASGQKRGLAALGQWWRQGARSAFFLRPHWEGLSTSPFNVAALIAIASLAGILIERLYIPGDATFYWAAVEAGWLSTAVTIWVCWMLIPQSRSALATTEPPSAAALFSMLVAQLLPIEIALACVLVPLVRSGWISNEQGTFISWGVWLVSFAWIALAQFKLLWQCGSPRKLTRVLAGLALTGIFALGQLVRPLAFWYPDYSSNQAAMPERLSLTQDLLERQPKLLVEQLAALRPERPGVIDTYAITYSPYADEDVFRRESAMVANVMEQRFDAQGRTIQLVNHRDTARELPWATPLNLQRTIQRMAGLMNPDEDILFIHLTSHGAHDGVLSTRMSPLTLDALTPAMLKGWLDEAKVRYRVISVSACYSGGWIEPLADKETLVMTAADAEHTSYGCGRGSELTYFGRAMYDEQLRHTWSFEEAHAAARTVIQEREKTAGKTDGFSNPQIRVGDEVRKQLSKLAIERAASAPR